MAKRLVRYYFGFASPFGALADSRIDEVTERVGAELDPVPLIGPPAAPLEGFAAMLQEYKRSYQYEDAARWARKLALAWTEPDDAVDARDASIGYYFARETGSERVYRNRVFRARWAEGRNIDDRAVLAQCARDVGIPADDFVASLDQQKYRDEFSSRGQAGLHDRVFGVPLFVVDGQRFWGNDRIDFLLEALSSD